MLQLKFKPELYYFDTCREFAEAFQLTQDDLVLTNSYIYAPFFGELALPVQILEQEKFGGGEPTDVMVNALLEALESIPHKRIIAIGGGTVIDIAKVLAVAAPGQRVDDLYASVDSLKARCELVIIPTTCGTGSEVTNISILNRTSLGTKMGLVSESMYAAQAVLIPELLSRLPYPVFATSALDALVHAVESALSGKATPYTALFSYKAIEMIVKGFMQMRAEGLDARSGLLGDFLLASNYAGLAFGTAGCAAVHALSYPLGGTFHVPHGEANYSIFIEVMKAYQKTGIEGRLKELLEMLGNLLSCAPEEAFDRLGDLLTAILPLKPLREYGMEEKHIREFASNVLATQQRLLKNNYVPLSEEQIAAIYAARF